MGIHREGRTWLIISFILWVSVTTTLYLLDAPILVMAIMSGLLGVIFLILLQFFRVPHRIPKVGDDFILCPADGKVVVIEKTFEPEYLKEDVIQISVFMSPFNVHKNWYPVSGEVEYYQYHPGKYLVAWHPKSSTENERSTTVIRRKDGKKILVRQIAGILARKICCYVKPKSQVNQGDELGFIKFGSRVDIFLPLDAEIKVQLNELVRGSQTILAILKQ
ncbi:MAG: phosphatidylserine decarboxylase family protein [Flavobacteriales bacterium]|nr:phosphatidylserine decarboxylase family protein [Flavobacteriales bacterium]